MSISPRTDSGKILEQYWHSIRQSDSEIPLRRDFKVSSNTAPILPFLAITEVVNDDIAFRLIGTKLAEHQGIDITGKHYSDYAQADQVRRAIERITICHQVPCGFVSVHTEEYARGTSSELEVTGYPLKGDHDEMLMVLATTPIGRGLTSKNEKPLFLRPASYIGYIDLGNGIPNDLDTGTAT